jgi:hypothetical protein
MIKIQISVILIRLLVAVMYFSESKQKVIVFELKGYLKKFDTNVNINMQFEMVSIAFILKLKNVCDYFLHAINAVFENIHWK